MWLHCTLITLNASSYNKNDNIQYNVFKCIILLLKSTIVILVCDTFFPTYTAVKNGCSESIDAGYFRPWCSKPCLKWCYVWNWIKKEIHRDINFQMRKKISVLPFSQWMRRDTSLIAMKSFVSEVWLV